MKKLILLPFCGIFLNHSGMAQTVKYLSDGADLQAEHNAATAGDSFILRPGTSSGNIVLSQQLTIIGPKYLNRSGPSGDVTCTGTFSVNSGSANSLITGLSFHHEVYLACSDIVFKRNNISSTYFYVERTSASNTALSLSNLEIRKNFIKTSLGLYIYGNPITTCTFQNNLIQGDMTVSHTSSSSGSYINIAFGIGTISAQGDGFSVPSSPSGVNLTFINNIFAKTISLPVGHLFSSASYAPVVFKYNVLPNSNSACRVSPPSNDSFNNLIGDIFAGFPSNAAGIALDKQYILSPLSPAKDFGR